MGKLPVILHLSDLQFGRNNRFTNGVRYAREDSHLVFVQRLLEDLHQLKRDYQVQPNVLVVSGDVAETAQKSEYVMALEFFRKLLSELSIPTHQVVVIPGNHDVNWKLCAAARLQAEASNEEFAASDPAKFKFFAWFYDELYEGKPPFADDVRFGINLMGDLGIAVLGFNSCVMETDVDHYGHLGVEVLQAAGRQLDVTDEPRKLLRIAVLHHNFLRRSKFDDESLRDADEIRPALFEYGFSLLLHGHQHVGDMRIEREPEIEAELMVLSTGSAGLDGAHLPDHPNQYQLISLT